MRDDRDLLDADFEPSPVARRATARAGRRHALLVQWGIAGLLLLGACLMVMTAIMARPF
jgi:hypothetical protein